MKRRNRPIAGASYECEYKSLFKLSGLARYEAIQELPIVAPSRICSFYKHCTSCPLALYLPNGHGLCADDNSEKRIYKALSEGAEFLTLEDVKK